MTIYLFLLLVHLHHVAITTMKGLRRVFMLERPCVARKVSAAKEVARNVGGVARDSSSCGHAEVLSGGVGLSATMFQVFERQI